MQEQEQAPSLGRESSGPFSPGRLMVCGGWEEAFPVRIWWRTRLPAGLWIPARGACCAWQDVTQATVDPCVKAARRHFMSSSFRCRPGNFWAKHTCGTSVFRVPLSEQQDWWFCLRKENRKSQIGQCLRNWSWLCICWICSCNIYPFVSFLCFEWSSIRWFEFNMLLLPMTVPWTTDPFFSPANWPWVTRAFSHLRDFPVPCSCALWPAEASVLP